MIELAFEGHRFWDLLRWKDAARYLSEPVRGWNRNGQKMEDYYVIQTLFPQRTFSTRDYLWPIKLNTLIVNSNLKQNPGWQTGD
jgi:hypothetical protein